MSDLSPQVHQPAFVSKLFAADPRLFASLETTNRGERGGRSRVIVVVGEKLMFDRALETANRRTRAHGHARSVLGTERFQQLKMLFDGRENATQIMALQLVTLGD